ncbi:hypothetical protein EMPG_16966 [Blastomyces silverae]|uniref:Uncharacterized protein n=1 Tax=Blastomyces silverae TaxID=2060906 RepID=A0A0H1BEA8_9EURO|nr:hypothetical protein EMPG_16966 [Blastomyces silverae]
MSFGFSPSDVFKLIEICHYIVVNCRHGPTSAAQAITGLREEQSLGNDHLEPPRPRLSIRRSREILVKSKNATRLGGEVVRHLAWGEKDIIALQERIERHKQSLGLEKTAGIGKRLMSMEKMLAELRAESTSTSINAPTHLDRGVSFSFPIDAGVTYATDRYQAILAAVERQREFAMLERNRAETGEDEEWETICDQLDLFHRRSGYRFEAGSTISTATESTSPLTSVFSFNPPSRIATTSTVDSIDPLMVNTNVSGMKRRPSSTTRREKRKHEEQKLQSRSPISPSSETESSHRPSFASSNGSGEQRNWKALHLWDGCPSPVYCALEAGHRSDGRLYAIKAVDLQDPQRQLPIIKLSSAERRPIPHTEPPGPRDDPTDAFRVYFVKPPIMKRGEESVQYFFENQKDQFSFQSLIYGRKLILATIIQKISSAQGKESDRQYIRIWEAPSPGHPRALLYFATARSNRKYIEINGI